MTVEEINDLILIADGFSYELGQELLIEEKKGCEDCGDVATIMLLTILKSQLEYQVSIGDYGTQTEKLYACLLSAVANYSGASITVDPNAQIPNTIIDVTIVGNDSPYEITFDWADFIDNGFDGRVRYENPYWTNWNPILSIDNMPYLVLNVDYALLSTGGFVLLPNGNVPQVYDGQLMRSVGYEPYTVVVTPPIITVQPQSQAVTIGDPLALNFTGSNYYFIQWQKDNVDIQGATSATFEIADFQAGDVGSYTVVLSNGNATLESSPAVITSASTSVQIFNKSDRKSDGTPNGAGRNVFLQFDGGGTLLSVGANTTIPPDYTTTVNFKQAGVDNLTLSIDGVFYPILGGDVDNIFPIEDFDPFLNNIYNNN